MLYERNELPRRIEEWRLNNPRHAATEGLDYGPFGFGIQQFSDMIDGAIVGAPAMCEDFE